MAAADATCIGILRLKAREQRGQEDREEADSVGKSACKRGRETDTRTELDVRSLRHWSQKTDNKHHSFVKCTNLGSAKKTMGDICR